MKELVAIALLCACCGCDGSIHCLESENRRLHRELAVKESQVEVLQAQNDELFELLARWKKLAKP